MASVNKVIIIGNLGNDPEIRYLPSGEAVANISVATTDKWKDKQSGEMKEATEWHRISFFGRLAEIAGEYLRKGSQVYVEGSLRTRKWTDKEGVERYTTEIRADEMKMLGSRRDGDGGGGGQRQQYDGGGGRSAPPPARPQQRSQQPATAGARGSSGFDDMDDDIPFMDPLKKRAFCLAL